VKKSGQPYFFILHKFLVFFFFIKYAFGRKVVMALFSLGIKPHLIVKINSIFYVTPYAF
jgi:hypothetical protein